MIAFVGLHADRMAKELATIVHPELRALLADLDQWSGDHHLPPVTVTQLVRYLDEQVAIYTGYWRGLVARLASDPASLSPAEREQAEAMREHSPEQLREAARGRFTWHQVACAADLRTRHYEPAQRERVLGFVRQRCQRPLWEVLEHDVAGPHLHVGRRDFSWRLRFPAAPKGVLNA